MYYVIVMRIIAKQRIRARNKTGNQPIANVQILMNFFVRKVFKGH